MKKDFEIIKNGQVSGTEIENLRVIVGWDSMKGKYDNIIKKSYSRYVVKDDDVLIGYLGILSDGIADAFLLDLMVHPEYRGKSIAKKMVKKAILDLKNDGVKCIQVIFDPERESFFKQFGFHILKAGIIDNDTMELPFSQA